MAVSDWTRWMASHPGSLEGAWGLVEDDMRLEAGHAVDSDPELVLSFISMAAVVVEALESKLTSPMSSKVNSMRWLRCEFEVYMGSSKLNEKSEESVGFCEFLKGGGECEFGPAKKS